MKLKFHNGDYNLREYFETNEFCCQLIHYLLIMESKDRSLIQLIEHFVVGD